MSEPLQLFPELSELPLEDRCAEASRTRSEILAVAKAGEFLVAYDLAAAGLTCGMAPEGLSYDVLVDPIDGALVLIQVKAASKPILVTGADGYSQWRYVFSTKMSKRDEDRADVYAFVALDQRLIIYRRATDVNAISIAITPDKFTSERLRLTRRAIFGA